MNTESKNVPNNEGAPQKERPQLLIDVFTLTGHPGTGKTATVGSLSRLLYIPRSRIFQAGEEFRKLIRKDTGHEVLDFAEREVELDIKLDSRMTEFMQNSTETGLAIAEGRLAGWIAKKLVGNEIAGKRPPNIISILLEADEEIRAQRVLKRDRKKNPNLTIEEVREKITNRAARDLEQWRKAYPELANIDPLNPNLLDQNGKRVYDLVIDTDYLKVSEVVGTIYNYLLENQLVSMRTEESLTLSTKGQIFPDP